MKIKGIEFKNVKTYKGHEDETCIYGNVYHNGKNIGEIREESWSGALEYTPNELGEESVDVLKEKAEDFLNEYPYGWLKDARCNLKDLWKTNPLDGLFAELHSIYFIEKTAKKMFKVGYPLYVIVKSIDHPNARTYEFGCTEEGLNDVLKEYPYLVAKLTKESFIVK